jgi:TRAP-type C4-dicarboxylate transport system permease small subunit
MKLLERIAAIVFGLAFVGLGLAVAVETVSRKVFNRSLQGVDELGGYILAVGASLAFAVALAGRAHIRIDLVHDHLPRFLRVPLNIVSVLAIAACAIGAAWMASIALRDTIDFNATAQTPWATPLKYPQGIWLAALVLFVAVAVIEVVRVLLLAMRGRFADIDRSYGPRGAKEELAEELADLEARGVKRE